MHKPNGKLSHAKTTNKIAAVVKIMSIKVHFEMFHVKQLVVINQKFCANCYGVIVSRATPSVLIQEL